VAEPGEPLIIQDYQRWAGRSTQYTASIWNSVLSVPLRVGRRLVGVITITDADPARRAGEGAVWGGVPHQGPLPDAVIVSDDAGQFRVGIHALCWVHAERLVHKLVPANDKPRNAIEVAKRMIRSFQGSLKGYQLAPSPQQPKVPRAPFPPHLQVVSPTTRPLTPGARHAPPERTAPGFGITRGYPAHGDPDRVIDPDEES